MGCLFIDVIPLVQFVGITILQVAKEYAILLVETELDNL